jgi:hypothetical protein
MIRWTVPLGKKASEEWRMLEKLRWKVYSLKEEVIEYGETVE